MTLKAKRIVIALLGVTFLASLLLVQWMEVVRKQQEAGLRPPHIAVDARSQACRECHAKETPGIVAQWEHSTHAVKAVGCIQCHEAKEGDPDGYKHEGVLIATLVTPRDCGSCHETEYAEFSASHHAAAGNILHSLDNFLAETVEGYRGPVNPHSPTPGMEIQTVNGMAAAFTGCQQCHGSKVALQSTDGGMITVDDLKPDENGIPTDTVVLAKIVKDEDGKPLFDDETWPNTGIGRLNLDGSRGSCSACHSRHDFSPRRARQPENCGKCHLGPDHPQKEIYEESKHGIAYRDLRDQMNLSAEDWVLGVDYSAAPTCATCHLSANSRDKHVTHDPGKRISWTNRPAISLVMDTDENGDVVKETDPQLREALVKESWTVKRDRMKDVCSHCHTPDYVNGFYSQYDEFVVLYNEKFAKPGAGIMKALLDQGLRTQQPFDDEIEWTWFYLWHHEGRRARHGASMMAPDYAHWHGTYEVAERFYQELIPQARQMADEAAAEGKTAEAQAVIDQIEAVLARPEHEWFESQKKARESGITTAAE
ncbi:MAG TPA: multiheme c-type cytochrome [Thermoguttaceae bacterium]|nr:multiheme c-type cytochrome [Thermoguttaceae bacterium]